MALSGELFATHCILIKHIIAPHTMISIHRIEAALPVLASFFSFPTFSSPIPAALASTFGPIIISNKEQSQNKNRGQRAALWPLQSVEFTPVPAAGNLTPKTKQLHTPSLPVCLSFPGLNPHLRHLLETSPLPLNKIFPSSAPAQLVRLIFFYRKAKIPSGAPTPLVLKRSHAQSFGCD